ncbi:MAG: superoxide dismutase family protein [Coleofasciculus sp. D1-CHI-01]|uniref:superoxide dismutase family protein n=1 Tax=Coleofasciculus sp. D1-CHI-01 TaxID=3068482 RepID=UPI0033044591
MNWINKPLRISAIAFFFSLLLFVSGCQQTNTVTEQPVTEPQEEVTEQQASIATATINSTSDPAEVLGEAEFTTTGDAMLIEVMMTNAPSGEHAFHIHETGNCAEQGKAAGGHFNPDDVNHGLITEDGFENAHAGDLGNITIAEDGTGSKSLTVERLTFTEGKYAIGNLSVILHEKPDDFGQPTGNAGGRVGCGIIEVTDS